MPNNNITERKDPSFEHRLDGNIDGEHVELNYTDIIETEDHQGSRILNWKILAHSGELFDGILRYDHKAVIVKLAIEDCHDNSVENTVVGSFMDHYGNLVLQSNEDETIVFGGGEKAVVAKGAEAGSVLVEAGFLIDEPRLAVDGLWRSLAPEHARNGLSDVVNLLEAAADATELRFIDFPLSVDEQTELDNSGYSAEDYYFCRNQGISHEEIMSIGRILNGSAGFLGGMSLANAIRVGGKVENIRLMTRLVARYRYQKNHTRGMTEFDLNNVNTAPLSDEQASAVDRKFNYLEYLAKGITHEEFFDAAHNFVLSHAYSFYRYAEMRETGATHEEARQVYELASHEKIDEFRRDNQKFEMNYIDYRKRGVSHERALELLAHGIHEPFGYAEIVLDLQLATHEQVLELTADSINPEERYSPVNSRMNPMFGYRHLMITRGYPEREDVTHEQAVEWIAKRGFGVTYREIVEAAEGRVSHYHLVSLLESGLDMESFNGFLQAGILWNTAKHYAKKGLDGSRYGNLIRIYGKSPEEALASVHEDLERRNSV